MVKALTLIVVVKPSEMFTFSYALEGVPAFSKVSFGLE
jgi:hypothetical protein